MTEALTNSDQSTRSVWGRAWKPPEPARAEIPQEDPIQPKSGQDGRVSPRLPPLAGRPIGFGHRGAMAEAPENTMESFSLAIKMGATGIESDVWVTRDQVAVLVHDGKVGPFLRKRPIAELTRAELPDEIPTLTDLIELTGPAYPISLDLKDPDAFDAVVQAARDIGETAEQNLWLCHPDLDIVTSWRSRTKAKLVNSVRLRSLPQGLERRASELQERGIETLNLHHSDWNGGRVALAHRFGLLAFGWGANHDREIAAVLDAGIDAVYSDHVDRMMASITEFYGADDR